MSIDKIIKEEQKLRALQSQIIEKFNNKFRWLDNAEFVELNNSIVLPYMQCFTELEQEYNKLKNSKPKAESTAKKVEKTKTTKTPDSVVNDFFNEVKNYDKNIVNNWLINYFYDYVNDAFTGAEDVKEAIYAVYDKFDAENGKFLGGGIATLKKCSVVLWNSKYFNKECTLKEIEDVFEEYLDNIKHEHSKRSNYKLDGSLVYDKK